MHVLFLKNNSFIKLWLSHGLSQLTINLVNFLVLIRLFELTQSSIAVSLLWVAYSLPALLLAPFAGPIVDRFSKRKLMLATNILQSITVLLLLVSINHQFLMYVIVFAYSFFDQIYLPSQSASVPAVVHNEDLPHANTFFLLTSQFSFLIGFGLGGLLVGLVGTTLTIVFSAISLAVAAISVYTLPNDDPKKSKLNESLIEFINEFQTGLKYVSSHRSITLPVLTIGFIQVAITIFSIILPSYAKSVLGITLSNASLVIILPGAIGAIIFSYILPMLLKRYRKLKIIRLGLLIAAIALLLLATLPMIGSYKLVIASATAFMFGICLTAIAVPSHTALQEKTDKKLLGRVYSSLNIFLIIVTCIPLLLSAAIAEFLGVTTFILFLSIITFILYLFLRRKGAYVLANGFRF